MPKPAFPVRPDYSSFELRVGQLRNQLSGANPQLLAENTGSDYVSQGTNAGEFHLVVWSQPVVLTYPELQGFQADTRVALPTFSSALLLYYFNTADGAPLGGKWISFTDLPEGRFYTQAFQGYTGNELVRAFQSDIEALKQAAVRLGGRAHTLGDFSFEFQALPRVPVLVCCWGGDEDFPTSIKILFDSSARHYLPTDAYAILGSSLTRKLISAAGPNA